MSSTTVETKANWANKVAVIDAAYTPAKTNENASFTRDKYEPVRLSVHDYRALRQDGFFKVKGLIPAEDMRAMASHMDRVLQGEETAPGFPEITASMTEAERVAQFSRIHNAHRVHPMHERFLLHPRILDVVEQLNGPDVLALQSMSFFKQPGQPGQG